MADQPTDKADAPPDEEFYVGWQAKAPRRIGREVKIWVLVLLVLVAVLGFVIALGQRTIGRSVFEWGTLKSFTGILEFQPYPHLLIPRPDADTNRLSFSTYHLVLPFKFGLDPGRFADLEGEPVELKGTLIYRDSQTMIEARPESIKPAASRQGSGSFKHQAITSLGRQTLVGEIVDSKCFFGVMNPGQLIPHRACAIRCISGGIPPVLLVRQRNGNVLYFMLVSKDGQPVNQQVLDLVAEPVEITGEVQRQGDLLILRADPSTYKMAGES